MSSSPAAKTLGLNASALRKQKGWSQDAFAKHLGWPLCTVVELEAGAFDGHGRAIKFSRQHLARNKLAPNHVIKPRLVAVEAIA